VCGGWRLGTEGAVTKRKVHLSTPLPPIQIHSLMLGRCVTDPLPNELQP
jgi:hypothetical protein